MKIKKTAAVFAVLIILISSLSAPAFAADIKEVAVGGMPFGVKFATGKILVGGLCAVDGDAGSVCPAKDAGIAENDIILKVNGNAAGEAEDVTSAVENSGGESMIFTVEHDGKMKNLSVTPQKSQSSGKFRVGLILRDSSAGIGTVTFILPETGAFGGLGHGICDKVTGDLCPIRRGCVSHVTITEISKGTPGAPGELRGIFSNEKSGSVISNTHYGVFGVMTDFENPEMLDIGSYKEGKAEIITTLDGEAGKKYSVSLSENPDGPDGTFSVEITDDELISRTGGIVQGMSGSPIIQDGKIVGAVTHVLIGDPHRGYGIRIGKMLDAMPDKLK